MMTWLMMTWIVMTWIVTLSVIIYLCVCILVCVIVHDKSIPNMFLFVLVCHKQKTSSHGFPQSTVTTMALCHIWSGVTL